MASQPNIEYEAAKFLQKLIQDSKDEPEKLATKLYVILQHMRASGKENSMPYQVISRAMETVVNQHGLDIESLKPPRNPTNTGPQMGDSVNQHSAGCSQLGGAPQDSKSGLIENDPNRTEAFSSSRPPAGPGGAALDTFPGVAPHRSAVSFEHESPSSIDTRSANSASYEKRDSSSWEQQATQKDKRSSAKRKRPESSAADALMDDPQQLDSHLGFSDARQGALTNKIGFPGNWPGAAGQFHAVSGAPSPYPVTGGFSGSSLEPSAGKMAVGLDYWNQGPSKDAPTAFSQGHLLPTNQREMAMGGVVSGPDMSMRSGMPRDTGKSPLLSTPSPSMPFKEHHLKQLRAQCLVFLAFRNGLMPKRLHLEIALGNTLPKEGSSAEAGQRELADNMGKEMTTDEPYNYPDIASLQGSAGTLKTERVPPVSSIAPGGLETVISRKEAGFVPFADPARNDEERKQPLGTRRALEDEVLNQERAALPPFLPTQSQPEVSVKKPSDHDSNFDNGQLHAGAMNPDMPTIGLNKQFRPEMVRWATVGGHNEASKAPLSASVAQHELPAGKDKPPSNSQGLNEIASQGQQYADGNLSLPWKPVQGLNNEKQRMVTAHDATMLMRHGSNGHSIRNDAPFSQVEKVCESEETDNLSAGVPPPNYTTSEKWIMIQQKRRVVHEENWIKKQQNVDLRIAARFKKLKETVSSSEDISAKTRSVIELKKLQLLELQRRLRSNMLNDFFKPITTEVDRLKAIKKHRVGRRLKHVEKYEQRMKEERQKRMRERQKEFFSEVEVHKERLDDVFKFKRERWRGFNRYIKEFHKKKERVHREKIDRIQREKINLLKINDVEGYLRMVQDAKSDRVNKLLKETEKYLQKLGARLQEAKTVTKHFETDTDGNDLASVAESNDIAAETEDEGDQARHYKESNEKYYLIAHSIKENITEQPTGLIGGKLREYQMNGLRWLVSLYNNHLNGILADEMGLGKTVQVISLICYLMEAKNDRGPFLVVVPSSVLPGWETELNFWAPGVNKIVYAGPPEERRRLFKECIIHQKFNVLLTTYEYLMNKHDRPKLSKIQWHYVIIDEGHRIKNASCKLNADLKYYQSSHRLLLTGTPLQNNLEELWALLNFLLPNIFNSSEDFSQWFNKPFEGNGDNPADEALLSEEENLLIINRLHQVLRPFVLRRLKHKVENELPEKIERLVRCEASAYQKLLMKRVEDNLGALGNSKARAVHNSVMELRNICNHPYISQLHVDEVDTMIPKHFLPPIVRLCGKLEMLDRLLPKLKATNHRVLFFSTMTRLLDVMEEYLAWKQYHYLRLDGHTSGQDRGALIDQFNRPDSPYFIFLLSIRAGGVGVNLQAADTVIIFDTDWNPQVDLQAQARAHRIGQKKDVLVLRLETVHTVEEQVRASAEHKLGVANQSITAGFFDNNTSAEDRREYLEALLRECKKEEAALVLGDDALNDLLARSEFEIDVFESVDQKRREEELATWKRLTMEQGTDDSQVIRPLPSRLVTDDDLKPFCEAMKAYEVSGADSTSDVGVKRKTGAAGGFDTLRYGRGKRAREVRSYEEQWSEEEFEKICQAESPDNHKLKEELKDPQLWLEAGPFASKTEPPLQIQQAPPPSSGELSGLIKTEATPPVKRGRGRPRRMPPSVSVSFAAASVKPDTGLQKLSNPVPAILGSSHVPATTNDVNSGARQPDLGSTSRSDATPIPPAYTGVQTTPPGLPVSGQLKGQNRKGRVGAEPGRRRGRKPGRLSSTVSASVAAQVEFPEQSAKQVSMGGSSALTGLPPPEESKPESDLQDPCAYIGQFPAPSSALPSHSNTPVTNIETGPATSQSVTVVTDSRSNPHASGDLPGSRQTQNPQREGEAATVAEPSSYTSAGLIASETASHPAAVTVVDSGPLLSSAAIGAVSTSCTSVNPPSKRHRRNTQSGLESSISVADKSAGQLGTRSNANIVLPNNQVSVNPSSSDMPPGRRQSRKSQSGGEPVRRRGKRQTLAATIAAASSAQHSIPDESTRNLPMSEPQAVALVPPPPGGASQGVGSEVVAVPVTSFAPVLGSVEGSTVLEDATLGSAPLASQPLPSIALTCQTAVPRTPLKPDVQNQKGPAVETAPRRRGRKKSQSLQASQDKPPSLLESTPKGSMEKGIMTGGQQKDAKESKKAAGEDSSIIQPPVSVSHHPNSAENCPIAKSNDSNVSSTFFDKTDLEANELDRRLKGSNASLTKEVGTSVRLVNPPPKSSTVDEESSLHPGRRTTVVVLALKTSAPISECKISQAEVDLGCKVSHPEVQVKPNAESTCHPDEDMAAPPGFDTPHAYPTDATETSVLSQKEDGADKEDVDASMGVLQKESTPTDGFGQTLVDPVQVSGEESAPPGLDDGDVCGLKTVVVTSLRSELKDAPAMSSAQTQVSEPPAVPDAVCHENVEDSKDFVEKDSAPPVFSVVQSQLAEDDCGKVVLTGTGEVLGETTPIEVPIQVPPAGDEPVNQSPSEGKNENLRLLPGRTLDVDGCLDKCVKESLEDGTKIAQEESHVHQETVFDLSGGGKSDPSIVSVTKDESMAVISDENSGKDDILPAVDNSCVPQADADPNVVVDIGHEPAMPEQESFHKSGIDSSSRDGINKEVTDEMGIHVSMEEDHQKNLHGAAEAQPYSSGTLVDSESEVYEQENSNKANSIPVSSESRQPANGISTDTPEGKNEDDRSAQLDLSLASNHEIDICKGKTDSILSADSSFEPRELAEKAVGVAEAQNCSPAITELVDNTHSVDSSSVSIPVTDDQNQPAELHGTVSPHGVLSDHSASKDVNDGVPRDRPAVSSRNEEESGRMGEKRNDDVKTSQNNIEGDDAELERHSDALLRESKSESCGGLKEPDEGAELGETCTGGNSSLEMETDASGGLKEPDESAEHGETCTGGNSSLEVETDASGGLKEPDESAELGETCPGGNSSRELETDASWEANDTSNATEISAGKEDVAASKGALQTESRPTVGSDQNLVDPIQVLVKECAPSGLGVGDVFGLKTAAVGSSCSELKDAPATSPAQNPVSESSTWPAAACHENVEDSKDFVVKDSAPPVFSVVQSRLEEDDCGQVVLTETGEVPGETTSIEVPIKVPTAGKDPENQSSSEGANENLPLLPARTLDVDGCLDNRVKESLEGSTEIAQEESHLHQEAVFDSSGDRDKGDPSIVSGTTDASMAVISDENAGKVDILPENDNHCEPQANADTNTAVDIGHEPAMREQESIHRSGTGSSSRDGVDTEVADEINIHVGVGEGHWKNLQGAAVAEPYSTGASANSGSEVYEQEYGDKANLMPYSSEFRQPADEISTDMHDMPPEGKDEDDQSAQLDLSLASDHGIDISKSKAYFIPSVDSSLVSRELAEKAVGVAEAQNSLPAIREHVDNTRDVDSSSVGISVSVDQNQSAELHGTVSPRGILSDPSASKNVNGGVQSDHPAVSSRNEEESGLKQDDNLETRQNNVEGGEAKVGRHSDASFGESKSESSGGLKQHDERAELGETCPGGNSSHEMKTDASCDANDTSKAESTSASMVPKIRTDFHNLNRVENTVASSVPQMHDDGSVSTPGLAENSEKCAHPDGENIGECDTSNISLTCQKDEVHSLEQFDANNPSTVSVEEAGAELKFDLKSNTEEPHGLQGGKQELSCDNTPGTDSGLIAGHIRSSDAGNDLALASKDDNSRGLDAPTDEAHSEACVVQDDCPTDDKRMLGSGLAGISEVYSSSDEENPAEADAPSNSLTTDVDASLASQDQDGSKKCATNPQQDGDEERVIGPQLESADQDRSKEPASGPQLESDDQDRSKELVIGPQLESVDEDRSNEPATSLEPETANEYGSEQPAASPQPEVADPGGSEEPATTNQDGSVDCEPDAAASASLEKKGQEDETNVGNLVEVQASTPGQRAAMSSSD